MTTRKEIQVGDKVRSTPMTVTDVPAGGGIYVEWAGNVHFYWERDLELIQLTPSGDMVELTKVEYQRLLFAAGLSDEAPDINGGQPISVLEAVTSTERRFDPVAAITALPVASTQGEKAHLPSRPSQSKQD